MGDMQRAYVDLRTALQARPEWTVLHALHARFLLVANKIQPAVRECWSLAQSWMALRRPPLVIASPPPKSQAHAKGKPPAKGTDKLPDKPSDKGTDKGGASAAPPDGGTAGVDKSSGGEKATGGAAKAGGAGAGTPHSEPVVSHDRDGFVFSPGLGAAMRIVPGEKLGGASGATPEAVAKMASSLEGLMVELMAECALLLDRPRDAAALLLQLTEPPRKKVGEAPKPMNILAGLAGGAAGGAARQLVVPPTRLALLAAAWQCAGELGLAAEASARACSGPSMVQLINLSPAVQSLFWLRRGHLLVGMHRPVDAADAYRKAVAALPTSAAAAEGLVWARHLCGAGDGDDGVNADRTLAADRPLSDRRIVQEYDRLIEQHPWSVRVRLHYAHVLWRRHDYYCAASQLDLAAELAKAAQPHVRGIALAVRALVGLRAELHGTALEDLNEARRHVATTTLDECIRHPLPPHARQLVHYVRGTCLLRIHDVPAAVKELELVDVRHALPKAEAESLAILGYSRPLVTAASLGSALDETAAHAVRAALTLRAQLAEASRLQLAFCAAFNLGLGYWRLCQPADALRALLSAQRCAHALARLSVAIATAPPPPPTKAGAKATVMAPVPAAPDSGALAWPVGAPPALRAGAAASAHIVCAQALQRLGRSVEALSHFEAGLHVQPGCLAALLGRGDLHFDRGEVRQARRAYCRAASLHPLSPAPHVRLARLYHHMLQEETASRLVTQAR